MVTVTGTQVVRWPTGGVKQIAITYSDGSKCVALYDLSSNLIGRVWYDANGNVVRSEDIAPAATPTPTPVATPSPTPAPDAGESGLTENGTAEQQARLDAFLAEHPTGSPWGQATAYKKYKACTAFAFQAFDTVFGEDVKTVTTRNRSDIRQYSIVELMLTTGSHFVFVLRVNEDGTITTAEGNVNEQVFLDGVYDLSRWAVLGVINPA